MFAQLWLYPCRSPRFVLFCQANVQLPVSSWKFISCFLCICNFLTHSAKIRTPSSNINSFIERIVNDVTNSAPIFDINIATSFISFSIWEIILLGSTQERPQDFGYGVNAPMPPEAKKILKIWLRNGAFWSTPCIIKKEPHIFFS